MNFRNTHGVFTRTLFKRYNKKNNGLNTFLKFIENEEKSAFKTNRTLSSIDKNLILDSPFTKDEVIRATA